MVVADEKSNVAQIAWFATDELGDDQAFDGRALEAQASYALKKDGLERAQFSGTGIDQLKVGTVRQKIVFQVEKETGGFGCPGEFTSVVVAGGFPDIEVAGGTPVHARRRGRLRNQSGRV
jgi:hypothetical protein